MRVRTSIAVIAAVSWRIAAPQSATAQSGVDTRPPNGLEQKPAFAGQTDAPEKKSNVAFDVVTVASGFENPWGVAFLPNGKMLVTERPGRLRIVTADGKLSEPVTGLPAVDARGQGGLLDVALDPNFASNGLIYWTYAEPGADSVNNTAAARGKLVDGNAPRVEDVKVIYSQRPSMKSRQHYGSRLVFARDGKLYITQGERSITEGRMQAQNMDGLL
ncbi:MAG TPA: PQQ-dependent sugar dehydrogenase, partial [Gemmatimonadaceae bacterium]|nr:PQQ-dependent sugar dehydrogenase [Gemmatimonadaceae bacterium]